MIPLHHRKVDEDDGRTTDDIAADIGAEINGNGEYDNGDARAANTLSGNGEED